MNVHTANDLRPEHIEALVAGQILALRIPGYYPPQSCQNIAARMRQSELYGCYANAPLIGRVGQAYFESLASETRKMSYQAHAVEWIHQLRATCNPYLTPIDKFRLDLDELWPWGASLGTLEGKRMFVGLARVFEDGAFAEPHQDHLEWDAPEAPEVQRLTAQLAMNVYLRMPPQGGDLLIWPKSLTHLEYHQFVNPGSYGLRSEACEGEPLRITPGVGELVVFNSHLVHAVTPSQGGDRITWSSFVGYQGLGAPLVLWS